MCRWRQERARVKREVGSSLPSTKSHTSEYDNEDHDRGGSMIIAFWMLKYGSSRYDVHKMFGFFDPLPLVLIWN